MTWKAPGGTCQTARLVPDKETGEFLAEARNLQPGTTKNR